MAYTLVYVIFFLYLCTLQRFAKKKINLAHMLRDIKIRNFKSITELDMQLGTLNVLIGANGSGKSNILEAFGMVAANSEDEIDLNRLSQAGIRVARPDLMVNSFLGQLQRKKIEISIYNDVCWQSYVITRPKDDYIMAPWHCDVENHCGESTPEEFADFLMRLRKFEIYAPEIDALRGLSQQSNRIPIGIHGEGFDTILNLLSPELRNEAAREARNCIEWMERVTFDRDDELKVMGYKLGRSTSHLFFSDRYMQRKNNFFSAENANEGALVVLFYLTLIMSDKTPKFFAIDNVDTRLNPKLCRYLIKLLYKYAKQFDKQLIVTTHNPAILDGINLNDDDQRLFVVSRSDEGDTRVKRIRVKPEVSDKHLKLSEMWMNGMLGGLPENF